MIKRLHVLGIDDHAVVLAGYHSIFKSLDVVEDLKFTGAHDCRSGYDTVLSRRGNPFDMAVLDYSIPHYPEKELYSGQDMALLVRREMPACRIVMMTMHKEAEILGSVLDKVKPEGFVNKSDCSTEELMEGFKAVLEGHTYFSETITKFITRRQHNLPLEDIDIKIILLLAKGVKTKNLSKHIPLSDSAIEKRKYRLKRLLDIAEGDEELIHKARSLGYI